MNFFSTIKATFFNPSFYKEVADGQRAGAFGYYFKLALLLSVISTILFSLFVGPTIHEALRTFPDAVVSYYPDDLEVTLTDGAVTINQPEPYALPFPQQWVSEDAGASPSNLIVFDTASTFTTAGFEQYDTLALVTGDALVMQSDREIRVVPMSDFACESKNPGDCNYTLTNDKLSSFMTQLKPLSVYILPILAVGILLVLMVVYAFGLLTLLITSLAAFVAVRWLVKAAPRLSYKQTYRLCLYAVTPALILGAVTGIVRTSFGIPTPFVDGYLFELVLTLIVLVLNLRAAYPTIPTAHAEAAPAPQQ